LKTRFWFLLALVISLGLFAASAHAQSLDQKAFATRFLAAAKARWPEAKITQPDPLALSITFPDAVGAQEQRIYMDNAWAEYQHDPTRLDTFVASRLDSVDESRRRGEAPPERSRVFPVVKGSDYLASNRKGLAASDNELDELPLHQRLNADLTVMFVEDLDTGMRFLTPSVLKDMELTQAELMALALANMRRHFAANPPAFAAPEDMPDVHYINGDGFYEPSLMLVDDYWQGLGLDGAPVVFPVARDMVLVVDSSKPDVVEQVVRIARNLYPDSTYNISPLGFVRKNGTWLPLEPKP